MKYLKYTVFVIFGFGVIYAVGPKVKHAPAKLLDTEIEIPIQKLDSFIAAKESQLLDLKEDNQARIIWADSAGTKTEYAVVYLHGFSASQEEGAPVHEDFAKRYGMNLYLTRLEDHGRRDTNSFQMLTPENYLQSAEDAIDIGKKLGDKVIVMSCSTGGTLSLVLAAAGEKIHSLILYSPNIAIFDPKSTLLLYPWGKHVSDIVMGGEHNRIQYDDLAKKYWNSVYHTNSLFTLQSIIETHMTAETFSKINIPVFLGYYYKDEANQDNVVSVARMLEMYDQLGTEPAKKRKVAFPETGHHVISSHVISKDIDGVRTESFKFAEEVLGLVPKNIQ